MFLNKGMIVFGGMGCNGFFPVRRRPENRRKTLVLPPLNVYNAPPA